MIIGKENNKTNYKVMYIINNSMTLFRYNLAVLCCRALNSFGLYDIEELTEPQKEWIFQNTWKIRLENYSIPCQSCKLVHCFFYLYVKFNIAERKVSIDLNLVYTTALCVYISFMFMCSQLVIWSGLQRIKDQKNSGTISKKWR